MENILIVAIFIVGLFLLFKHNFRSKKSNIGSDICSTIDDISSEISHKNKVPDLKLIQKIKEVQNYVKDYEPTQEDIQETTYVDKTKTIADFPYPQISRGMKKLSEGKSPFPLNNDSKFQPNGDRDLKFIRRTDIGS